MFRVGIFKAVRRTGAAICALALLPALVLLAATPALAAKSASLVIDANTGRTLHASDADKPRYPASLTKMMTLYMVFDAIERGKLKYSSRIRVSEHAAARPPSKLGLKAGQTISVRAAVAALITKSANDVASAVAEHISGSEPAFARAMTRKARSIGMRRTTFRNASGLPDRRQLTTARDMVRLALRMQDNFPNHYRSFRMTHFKWKGRTYRTTNTLVRTMRGTDGIKTGYTRASGFNLVSSIKRGQRHVVAAVFGGRSARGRNKRMRILLTRGLAKASTRKTRKRAPQPKPLLVAKRKRAPVRAPRLIAKPRTVTRVAARTPQPAIRRAVPSLGRNVQLANVRRVALTGERRRQQRRLAVASTAPPRSITDILSSLKRKPALARRPSTFQAQARALGFPQGRRAPVRGPAQLRGTLPSGLQIQVGAYRTEREALQRINAVRARAGRVLGNSAPYAMPVATGSRQLYRARFAGFNARSATAACVSLRRQGIDCHVAR